MLKRLIQPYLIRGIFIAILASVHFLFPAEAFPSVKVTLEPGLTAELNDEREIELSACQSGDFDLQEWTERLLATPEMLSKFVAGECLRIPFNDLSPEYQLETAKVLFPQDTHTEAHWVHKVTYLQSHGAAGETLWSISKWFTANPRNYLKIRSYNKMSSRSKLYRNTEVKIPLELLSPAFRDVIIFEAAARRAAADTSAASKQLNGNLLLKMDPQGTYASYRMKRGDTIYSNVVMNFTDRVSPEDVLEAARIICKRSGIRDPRRLKSGDEVKIPLDLLSVMYLPPNDPRRIEYEQLQKEADKYSNQVHTEDLKGVIVILDPGHGGNDPGTVGRLGRAEIYEDEFVYDIVCRIKRLLETTTMAKVELTLVDKSINYDIRNVSHFQKDTDEYVLTNPIYRNHDPKISANLRWYLANSIFRRVTAAGADPDKVVFVSFHADSLHPDARGSMIYIPGTYLCKGNGGKTGYEYTCRAEVKESQYVKIPYKQRVKSEGLSGDFAKHLIKSLHSSKIGTHDGKPIRNQIVRRRHAYVPAVIRHNLVPTKILVEVVNMNNTSDCKLLTDPDFREKFAAAFVNALKQYYDGEK
jgi:N-acetylmuramoyl-L-alanine amidase